MRVGMTQMIDGQPGRGLEFIQATAVGMERRGFVSFWCGDHIVFFQTYDSQYPDGGLGDAGFRVDQGLFEPMLTLTAAALATTELRIGLSVEILPERNPVVRARDIATLDNFSNGRFDYGIGIGWAKEEYAAVGVPYERRGARCDEYVGAMKALWTQSPSSYHGEFVNFDNVVAYPKPVQRPHPPILVGGNTRAALRRAARLGDGWFGWGLTVPEIDECLVMLDEELGAAGRDRDDLMMYLGLPYGGDLETLVEYLTEVERRGFEEAVIGTGLSRKRYETQLDDYALALDRWTR
jgi:probable F420-dependent oxidoreductase